MSSRRTQPAAKAFFPSSTPHGVGEARPGTPHGVRRGWCVHSCLVGLVLPERAEGAPGRCGLQWRPGECSAPRSSPPCEEARRRFGTSPSPTLGIGGWSSRKADKRWPSPPMHLDHAFEARTSPTSPGWQPPTTRGGPWAETWDMADSWWRRAEWDQSHQPTRTSGEVPTLRSKRCWPPSSEASVAQ